MKDLPDMKDARFQGLAELLFLAARDSAYLNTSQKRVIEEKIREIARIAVSDDYAS